jgi:hypothetical protein
MANEVKCGLVVPPSVSDTHQSTSPVHKYNYYNELHGTVID